ncbi:MAG TPA: TlpA disulfide reductase family protein [Arachnia sp.]|nr:TlpA disulfide reductase family protein [Arachnia sp.]
MRSSLARGRLLGVLGLAVLVALVVGGIYLVKGGAASEAAPAGQTVRLEGPSVGSRAPGFKALDIHGVPVSLEDYAGRPVWLLFQATWCSICRAELPDVEAASDRIDVVAIYLREDRELVTDYAARMGLSITSVPDPIGEISLRYLASSVPTHYFVNADGTVASIRKGALSPEEIDQQLALVGRG